MMKHPSVSPAGRRPRVRHVRRNRDAFFSLSLPCIIYVSQSEQHRGARRDSSGVRQRRSFFPREVEGNRGESEELDGPVSAARQRAPSSARIFATPMYNTLEPPPRGARRVAARAPRDDAAGAIRARAPHPNVSSRQPETSKLPAPDPGPIGDDDAAAGKPRGR